MKRTLVLLTLDEIDGCRALVPGIQRDIVVDEILAVDGGSTDGTVAFLRDDLGIRILGQDRRGRGEAFRVAVAGTEGDALVFFSPDGNEDPSDIPKLFALLESGADMAIASRFLPGARNEEDDSALPLRKWVNLAFTWLANRLWNRSAVPVTDTINGFRGVRRHVFELLAPRTNGYTIEFELTISAMRRGLSITEIPTLERDRIAGKTKGPSLELGIDFLRFFLGEVAKDLGLAK